MPKHKINAWFHVGGRQCCWNKFSGFLERQTYPHKEIKLIVVNTTPKHQFYKEWLETCDYEYVYIETQLKSNERGRRLFEMAKNQVAILDEHLDAEYLLSFDDDIIPPDNLIENLLPHFNTDKVLAVSGVYRLNPRINRPHLYCCWPHSHKPPYYTKSTGIQIVGAACWGCCLFKLGPDGKLLWSMGPEPGVNADVAVFRRIHKLGGIAKVNWDMECDHLADNGSNPYPSKQPPII